MEEKGLSPIELFMLKSVLKHGQLNLIDIENATGIPSGPLRVLLYKLVHLGLLDNVEGDYTARKERAEKAVETGSCVQDVESTMAFVYLPRTGDLGNLSDERFQRLSGITSLRSGPIPREQHGLLLKEVLQNAITRTGQNYQIIGVDNPLSMPAVCPVFAIKGELKLNAPKELWVSFLELDAHNYFDFSFAHGLVDELLSLSLQRPGAEHVRNAISRYFPHEERLEDIDNFPLTSPSRMSMAMPLDIIERIYPERTLTTGASMIVHWETDKAVVKLENSVRFLPATKQEATSFARDRVVQRVCANGSDPNNSIAGWIKEACEEFGSEEGEVTKLNILDRLWELKRYVRVYALQTDGVFDYDEAT
jgi:hypothetical protein